MSTEPKTFERFLELWEADREDEAWALAGELHDDNFEEFCRILTYFLDVPMPTEEEMQAALKGAIT